MTGSKCIGCTQCVEACPSEAIKRWGEHMTVEEVMKVIGEGIENTTSVPVAG